MYTLMDFFLETTLWPLGGAAPCKFLHALKTDQGLLAMLFAKI